MVSAATAAVAPESGAIQPHSAPLVGGRWFYQSLSTVKNAVDWYERKIHDLTFKNLPEPVAIVAEAAIKALPLLAIFTFAPTWASVMAGLTVVVYTIKNDPNKNPPYPSLINAFGSKVFLIGCRYLANGNTVGGLAMMLFGAAPTARYDGCVLNRLYKSIFRGNVQQPQGTEHTTLPQEGNGNQQDGVTTVSAEQATNPANLD